MSTPDDRLQAIQANYMDAVSNEIGDLAKAQTSAQVAAVQANVKNAQLTFYTAEADALDNNGGGIETAYGAAKAALLAVQAARDASAEIATLLGALNSATSAATSLLEAAKSLGAFSAP